MAPTIAHYARSLLTNAVSSTLAARAPTTDDNGGSPLGPLAVRSLLDARSSNNRPDPESGILHAGDINNSAAFAFFGIIGAGFVIAGIWFFFWAKNGGFYFQKNDWEDYKSTVLRRKGPNGTILSGATPSTQLGGGSVYKDVEDGSTEGATTVVSGTTGITGGVSDVSGRERRRKKREQKEREKERRREEKKREMAEKKSKASGKSKHAKGGRHVGGDGAVVDDEAEAEAEEYLRNYRHERPARVGGLNKESDSSQWDGSTNPTESSRGGFTATESTVTSELISNRERTPTSTPTKKSGGGGIRKVYSTYDKRDDRESERIKAEARKLADKGRAAGSRGGGHHRRDFSWQRANRVDEGNLLPPPPPQAHEDNSARVPGSWTESEVGSDLGTKSYHCVIPGLSSVSGEGSSVAGTDVRDYAEEKRKKRSGAGGYRRQR